MSAPYNVKKMAVKLAKRYGADEEKAALAAIRHDSAKEISKDEMREIMRQVPRVRPEGGESRPTPVWHGICASILARTRSGAWRMMPSSRPSPATRQASRA